MSDKRIVDAFSDPPVPDMEADGLMVPPWIKFPNIPRGSIGWRMGMGEDYRDRFQIWYTKQLRDTHKRLWGKYPEPEDWTGFYRQQKMSSSSRSS